MDSYIELCIQIDPLVCHESVGDSLKATIPQSFSEFKHCIPCTDVDIENDEFTLKATGSDSVSEVIRSEQLV